MTDDTTPHGEPRETEPTVRTESWPCGQPAELELSIDVGRIDVALAAEAETVDVELRADLSRTGSWTKGLSGVLNWLGESTGPTGSIRIGGHDISFGGRDFPFGGPDFDLSDLKGLDLEGEAVRAAEITWTEAGRRLMVHSPTRMPLRIVPLILTVRAPANSRMVLRTGSGQITVTGRSGQAKVRTGSGDVELDTVAGDLHLSTGSGEASAHSVSGRTKAKTGSGNLTLESLGGSAQVTAGSGDIRLGTVRADVQAQTGSGDLTVDDAERGQLSLTTGSGDLRVAVHTGVAAELDLRSSSGRAQSELDVSDTAPPGGAATLRVQGRTGNGNVLVTRAFLRESVV